MQDHPAATCRPAARVSGWKPYKPSTPPYAIDLWLNGNEGAAPPLALLDELARRGAELLRRYPSADAMAATLAERWDLPVEHVLVTAGADDALFRACMAYLDATRECILPVPTFEMLPRYARLAGAKVVEITWPGGDYPIDAVLGAVTPQSAMIAVVSPNNPTGATASASDLTRLAVAAPGVLKLVDLAYGEYADADLTRHALSAPGTLVVGTLSKAWGLAGLRVGYALGPPDLLDAMRTVGQPFAVSGPSIALAAAWSREGQEAVRRHISAVRVERQQLFETLRSLGAEPVPSQANFVLARFGEARRTWEALARRGIAVRAFPDASPLRNWLRITCPGDAAAMSRLVHALEIVMTNPAEMTP